MTLFYLEEEELTIWKQLLPAAVESCRRDWKHTENCEYIKSGKIPLSVEYARAVICGCGRGKDVKRFPVDSGVAGSLVNWVTRVAFQTLAAVPYVEATGNFEMGEETDDGFSDESD